MKEYSLVIASNFLDHYMLSLSNELKKYFKDFYFVASEKLEENYKNLGFADLNDNNFVIKAYEDKNRARQIIMDADVVITGSYLYQSHIRQRVKNNKFVIYYSERLFKKDDVIGKVLRYLKYNYRHHYDVDAPLLCVSGYAAGDYNSIGLFKDRTYKFGYFPEIKEYYDINSLINAKKKNSIIWVGRLIEWKHPVHAINVARKLKAEGYEFSMEMIGNGDLKDELHRLIDEYELNDYVVMFDQGMSPEQVRKHMEEAEIYLFTSDRAEGWGVVLNEALNSACACVASYSAGSTPFLMNDGVNGYVYKNEDENELYDRVKKLLDDEKLRKTFALKAYESIIESWNCKKAAERIYQMIDCHFNSKDYHDLYEEGIMSKAEPLE